MTPVRRSKNGFVRPSDAQQARIWGLDGPACMLARLVRHVSSSGRTRILVTSLSEDVATVAELAALHHGRWHIEVLANNLAAMLNRAVLTPSNTPEGVSRQFNRAAARKLLSRCIGSMLLAADGLLELVDAWGLTLSRRLTRHISGRSKPRNLAQSKPHPYGRRKR